MHESNTVNLIVQFVLQLSIIIIASWFGKTISSKLKIPHVIGYIFVGILIGPYILGSIPIPFTSIFHEGLFSLRDMQPPITSHIYALSSVASVLLLFLSGLETDMELFIKYSFKGTIVGISGLVVSFFGGQMVSMLITGLPAIHPTNLFMGTIATATSVGITTSVLSTQNKINSPEGVTMLSAAVLDDVIGIIILAIILGITDSLQHSQNISSEMLVEIAIIGLRTIAIWLVFTVIGIIFSRKFGKGIKKLIHDHTSISIISFGLALLLGGIFEILGISMVIGAYIIGLSLSNTDLSYVIQEKIKPVAVLLVPIFFIVTGMRINLYEIFHLHTLMLGSIFGVVCILAKVIGCGLPTIPLGFNLIGAMRIGVGMAPRGEIALIIAGLGISSGILNDQIFGVILIMIVMSSILAPIVLNQLLAYEKQGTKKPLEETTIKNEFDFQNSNLAHSILSDFIQLLEDEKFFINKTTDSNSFHGISTTYHIRKDDMFITLIVPNNSSKLIFQTDKESVSFIKTALYEAITNISESSKSIKDSIKKEDLLTSETSTHAKIQLSSFLSSSLVNLDLKGNNKVEIIKELSELLDQDALLKNKAKFIADVIERENSFSTGMQNGIAIPHAKTDNIISTSIAIGIKKEGLDFQSLDSIPAKIIILIGSTNDSPHISILTLLSTLLNNEEFRNKVLACTKRQEIVDLFSQA